MRIVELRGDVDFQPRRGIIMGLLDALKSGEQLQLCDAEGRILGVFLSPARLEQLNAEWDRLATKVEELRKQLKEAQSQIAPMIVFDANKNNSQFDKDAC